ncbi:hypothetical protein TVNIR_1851 [Thioalkalivibrio nitratireducens DSM 14787]|uniref:G domain-containing protein n=1 Tax=Thioalkalivibrio nitratireducens (strain DSM 14787 / UNIQEM 213 / ALEN2) TaxID=1255043 RepID=L0DWY0_THIND|nr:GTP-binding DUF697 domain-containing protein [Thioalkalivibrio nitratireducens]AGA33512.1 hypothetical protein TVNIR_1851 [Thioalkalivibrio nitratireducens DSM 14787]
MQWKLPNWDWKAFRDAVLRPEPVPAIDAEIAARAREQAPVLWLLGKVQSGKTSIIRAVTGHPDAGIGLGFRPCTARSRVYDFPEDVPIVRFLDTRGLGEVDYDPAEDLELVARRAHAVLAVVRAMEPEQSAILEVLHRVRREHPDWPVILVQTRLHDGYPDGRDHPPYAALTTDPALENLRRALQTQAAAFADLPGQGEFVAVPVDLTRPEEGFTDPEYGLGALVAALDRVCAQARAGMLRELAAAARASRMGQVHPHLLGYATAAGITDLVPVVGLVTVPTLQGKMLHSLASLYGLEWDRRTLYEFLGSLGSGALLFAGATFTARQIGKLVPVYGQTAGAVAAGAASAAVTYALGRAACQYLEQVWIGQPDPDGVARTYQGALKEAYRMFRQNGGASPLAGRGHI